MNTRFIRLIIVTIVTIGFMANCKQNSPTHYKDIEINGVKWATQNVGEIGTFVDNMTDYGNYYTWEEAQSVCPSGWRLPTNRELEQLVNSGSTWTTIDGITGFKFGTDDNTLFFPAAGRYDEKLWYVGSHGSYWSSTKGRTIEDKSTAYYLDLHNHSGVNMNSNFTKFGFCVRCVSE